jgi:hypothetical protein
MSDDREKILSNLEGEITPAEFLKEYCDLIIESLDDYKKWFEGEEKEKRIYKALEDLSKVKI